MDERPGTLTEVELRELAEWFRREMGADISMYRPEFLSRRFMPRISALGFRDLKEYLAFAGQNDNERRAARRRLLVPTTEFFRNRDVFDAFLGILKRPPFSERKKLTILSAPCSTGEEAASLAISCFQNSIDARIIALDRSLSSLRLAASGKYSKKALSKLDKNEIKRYFKEEGPHRILEDGILKNVFPLCCDLGSELPLKTVDAVFMRNFFIYLTDDAQKAVIGRVKKALADGGLLVLGKVERLKMDPAEWKTLDLESRIYMFKRGGR